MVDVHALRALFALHGQRVVVHIADREIGDRDIGRGEHLEPERHDRIQHAATENHDIGRMSGRAANLYVLDRRGAEVTHGQPPIDTIRKLHRIEMIRARRDHDCLTALEIPARIGELLRCRDIDDRETRVGRRQRRRLIGQACEGRAQRQRGDDEHRSDRKLASIRHARRLCRFGERTAARDATACARSQCERLAAGRKPAATQRVRFNAPARAAYFPR